MEFEASRVLIGLGVNAAVGTLAYLAGTVGRSGILAGLLVGTVIWTAVSWQGYLVLLTFFVLGSGVSKLGYAKKNAIGVAQDDGGRRGAKHAAANCGTGVICCVLLLLLGPSRATPYLLLVYIGSFATALADTTGSEIGQLYGKTPILITTFKRVPVGTDGAVSLEGTLAGIFASLLLALLGFLVMPDSFGIAGVLAVVLGAFVGTTAESYLGATLEGLKRIDNEVVNFANTVIGGAASAALFALLT